jgi:VanZ family protein
LPFWLSLLSPRFPRFHCALLGLGYPKAAWQSMLFALLATIGLEVLQRFVPGRHGQIEDAFIKAIGAVSGIGFVLVVDFVRKLRAR